MRCRCGSGLSRAEGTEISRFFETVTESYMSVQQEYGSGLLDASSV